MLWHRDDLICDMAQYYHVFDFEALPVQTLAALASGLPEDSRSKMRMLHQKVTTETMLLASCADRLGHIAWMLSKDGKKGRNHPDSILEALTSEKKEDGPMSFRDGKAFMAAREKILAKGAAI